MYKAKERKILPTPEKIIFFFFKSRELKGGMENRHGIYNHGLAMLFLKLNTCSQFHNHLLQPEEFEGAQAKCQSYD